MSKTFILIIAIMVIAGGIFWWQEDNIEEIFFGGPESSVCQNKCGDGVCQEIVCLAIGCPCSETKESCPQDCKELLDTSNWQTYRNEEYGFEVKYPGNFITQDSHITICKGISFWDKDFLSTYDISVNKIVTFDIFVDSLDENCVSGHYSSPAGPGVKTYKFLNQTQKIIRNFLRKIILTLFLMERRKHLNFRRGTLRIKTADIL